MEDDIVFKVTVEQAIDKLPDRRRKIAILFVNEGYSPKEISKKLKLSESQVYYHLNHIKKYLKDELWS